MLNGKCIAGVVPLFQPSMDMTRNIRALTSQVDVVYLINDGGEALPSAFVAEVNCQKVHVVDPASNRGVAAALNDGFERAVLGGAELLLSVDQDTELAPDAVERLAGALLTYDGDPSVAGCAAETIQGTLYECLHQHRAAACSVEVIQSGLLLKASHLKAIGFLNENLFIDGVDTELMLRFHSRGWHVVLVPGIKLQHAIGAPSQRVAFGRTVSTDNHSSLRRYYMTRNKIYLMRRYGRLEPQWARVVRRRLIRQSVVAVLVEDDRRRKLLAIMLGFLHGIFGRLGPRSSKCP